MTVVFDAKTRVGGGLSFHALAATSFPTGTLYFVPAPGATDLEGFATDHGGLQVLGLYVQLSGVGSQYAGELNPVHL